MSSPKRRDAPCFPPSVNDVEPGRGRFMWNLTPRSLTDPVVCKLPPSKRIYLIHPDGLIQKYIPRVITPGYENKILYQYVDDSGKMHDIGEYEFAEVQKYATGNVKVKGAALIIDLRTVDKSWRSGGLEYGFSMATTRPYIGDVALASIFGAMIETGYTDFTTTGFSTSEGKSVISVSHVNGENGDFRYLRNDGSSDAFAIAYRSPRPELLDEVRQNAFIAALQRFGWTSMLSYRYQRGGKERLLKGTVQVDGHHDHLHLQKYLPRVETIHE